MTHEQQTVLIEAATLINKGWTQGAMARDAEGYDVDVRDKKAIEWCAEGALYCAARHHYPLTLFCRVSNVLAQDIQHILESHINSVSLWNWNDRPARNKEEVVQLFLEVAFSEK